MRNVADGLYLWGWADVRDVTLTACVDGAQVHMESGLMIEDCVFVDCLDIGVVLWPPGQDQVISRCEFGYMVFAVAFVSTLNGVVRDCDIHDVGVGVQYQDGATGAIQNCTFRGVQNVTISGRRRVSIALDNNRLLWGPTKVDVDGDSSITGSRNVFVGSRERTFYITGRSSLTLHENHILPGSGSLIILDEYKQAGAPIVLDLTNNYWGGVDSAAVAAKIWDGNDDPIIKGFVQFTPRLDHPVPATATSLGGLKARYRGREE